MVSCHQNLRANSVINFMSFSCPFELALGINRRHKMDKMFGIEYLNTLVILTALQSWLCPSHDRDGVLKYLEGAMNKIPSERT